MLQCWIQSLEGWGKLQCWIQSLGRAGQASMLDPEPREGGASFSAGSRASGGRGTLQC